VRKRNISQYQQCTRIGEKKSDAPAIVVALVTCCVDVTHYSRSQVHFVTAAARSLVLASHWTRRASVAICCRLSVGPHRSSSVRPSSSVSDHRPSDRRPSSRRLSDRRLLSHRPSDRRPSDRRLVTIRRRPSVVVCPSVVDRPTVDCRPSVVVRPSTVRQPSSTIHPSVVVCPSTIRPSDCRPSTVVVCHICSGILDAGEWRGMV